jgi:EpsI family protein
VLYWYDFNGRTVQSIYRAKQYLAWDSLTRRRNNGAVVMIGWESSDGSDPERARIEAVAFARSILALLPRFIPS